MAKQGSIRVGVGGWTYEPWRKTFYPKGLSQKKELEYASRQLTAIEINGTYYSTQKPAVFAKWRDETPEGFVFSVKASRFATNRKVLAEAGESIERFVGSGLIELGDKLGPLLWQFMPTKKFDPDDFGAFLKLLPQKLGSRPLRHVLDVRHETFMTPEFLALAKKHNAATVFADSDDYPSFADATADFVYARLMRTQSKMKTATRPRRSTHGRNARACGPAARSPPTCRASPKRERQRQNEARRVRVHDQRRKGAGTGRRASADRAAVR